MVEIILGLITVYILGFLHGLLIKVIKVQNTEE